MSQESNDNPKELKVWLELLKYAVIPIVLFLVFFSIFFRSEVSNFILSAPEILGAKPKETSSETLTKTTLTEEELERTVFKILGKNGQIQLNTTQGKIEVTDGTKDQNISMDIGYHNQGLNHFPRFYTDSGNSYSQLGSFVGKSFLEVRSENSNTVFCEAGNGYSRVSLHDESFSQRISISVTENNGPEIKLLDKEMNPKLVFRLNDNDDPEIVMVDRQGEDHIWGVPES
jgi:hypothetical protein